MPNVVAFKQLPTLFKKIQEAQVPTKFNQDFMKIMLELKSTNFLKMIPFLLSKIGLSIHGIEI